MKIGLVWRTNVGKSTLFNRLLGNFRAIVTDIAWTTRDIIREPVNIDWISAVLLDSPGLDNLEKELQLIEEIIQQSDLVLFVVDGKSGLNPLDEKIFDLIAKNNKKSKTILVINKVDGKVYTDKVWDFVSDFYKFWINDIAVVSAKQNEGLVELVELIKNKIEKDFDIKELKEKEEIESFIPIAIVWRPNVGKSTLLNKLCWEQLATVSDKPWTTLDYISCDLDFQWKKYRLYDTAWIRKKWKIHWLERIAYQKTLKMLQYIKPVVVLLIDLKEWLVHRDMTLLSDILKLYLPVVVAVNKIDEFSKDYVDRQLRLIAWKLKFAKWIPILPISAKEAINLPQLFEWINVAYNNYYKRIPTWQLNQVLRKKWIEKPPRFPKNKICKFYYTTQIEVAPPTFKFFVNNIEYANFAFKKWLENTLNNTVKLYKIIY